IDPIAVLRGVHDEAHERLGPRQLERPALRQGGRRRPARQLVRGAAVREDRHEIERDESVDADEAAAGAGSIHGVLLSEAGDRGPGGWWAGGVVDRGTGGPGDRGGPVDWWTGGGVLRTGPGGRLDGRRGGPRSRKTADGARPPRLS